MAPSTTADLEQVVAEPEQPAVPLTLPVETTRSRLGVVRVGIWIEPEPQASHIGGDIVRALIEPQLFTPRPGGGWAPRLVEPGSVTEAEDLRSVSFRLRPGAAWSDGSLIGAADLQRTADTRFVRSVEGDGDVITVAFTQPLPGWRRLWSGIDSVTPPSEGVVGGPFMVERVEPGLETVLVPNDGWWGVEAGEGPWLEELHLVVVPDQTTMFQLFERGELDVIAPWAVPGRLVDPCGDRVCDVDTDAGGGWQAVVLVNPVTIDLDNRRRLLGAFDPESTVGALLKGEAEAITTPFLEVRDPANLDVQLMLTVAEDVPMARVAARGAQITVSDGGGVVPELRTGPSRLVAEWVAAGGSDVLVVELYRGPSACFTCLFGELLPGESALADAGDDEALVRRIGEDAVARWLWAETRVALSDGELRGVQANGWSMFVTWNAWQWSMGADGGP